MHDFELSIYSEIKKHPDVKHFVRKETDLKLKICIDL
jgi:hypothetical protein